MYVCLPKNTFIEPSFNFMFFFFTYLFIIKFYFHLFSIISRQINIH